MPNNKLPCLELEDGTKMGESINILRYLGAKYGYYPEDPRAAQECDEIIETGMGVFEKVAPLHFGPAENREAGYATLENVVLPKFMAFIDARCAKGEFLVGDKLTIADFYIGGSLYALGLGCESFFMGDEKRNAILDKYPNFKAYGERFVAANKKFLDSNPAYPI